MNASANEARHLTAHGLTSPVPAAKVISGIVGHQATRTKVVSPGPAVFHRRRVITRIVGGESE